MLGLVYLRARHYNPVLGRFLQRDTIIGFMARPQSLHRYVYGENNPANLVDPSGHQATCTYVNGSIQCNGNATIGGQTQTVGGVIPSLMDFPFAIAPPSAGVTGPTLAPPPMTMPNTHSTATPSFYSFPMLRPATPTIMPVPLSGPKPLGTLTPPLSSLTPLASACPTCTFTDEMAQMLLQQLGFELNESYPLLNIKNFKPSILGIVDYQFDVEIKLQVTPSGSEFPLLIFQPDGQQVSGNNLECSNDWVCKLSYPYQTYESDAGQYQAYSFLGQDFGKDFFPFPNYAGGGSQTSFGGNLYNMTLGCEFSLKSDSHPLKAILVLAPTIIAKKIPGSDPQPAWGFR